MPSELNGPERAQQEPLIAALREVFASHRDAVLNAPTGAGKSTLVPLALLNDAAAGTRIIMLEPRRVAARALAARMAGLLGESVGQTVGYRMRLDTRVSKSTRIEVVTEGVLTRMLQHDPALEGTAFLIFDEYHERSLAADLGLALALDAREQLGAPFRILIMSATLEFDRVAALLGDAAIARVPGRAFPVDIAYLGQGAPILPDAQHPLEPQMVAAVHRALEHSTGSVLVFLPGAGEIRRLAASLQRSDLPAGVQLHPLYGELSPGDQDAALQAPLAGTRHLVLATNIAETSLTIPGVTAVIDCGLARRARFDPATGMSRLELVRISRAASDQRAGRAGRVAPGMCCRLWSEAAHGRLQASTPPEILEADLAPLALELACWGTRDAAQLRWLDGPPQASLNQARDLLRSLDALDERGGPTAAGRELARLPVNPRLGRMLLRSRDLEAVPLASRLAALLADRDLLRRSAGMSDPDIRTRLELLHGSAIGAGARSVVDRPLLQRVLRSADSLQQAVARDAGRAGSATAASATSSPMGDGPCGALLALAYPDRIGQRRADGEGRYLLSNGRGAAFRGAVSLGREEFIVAVELRDQDKEARIDLAAPIDRSELQSLFQARIVREQQFGWDAREQAVVARDIRRLDALIFDSRPLLLAGDERSVAAMVEGVTAMGLQSLPWDSESRQLQGRMEFIRRLSRADLAGWPPSDDGTLLRELPAWLGPYLPGMTRRDHLAAIPLSSALRDRLPTSGRRALDELAPRELTVPSGSSVRIDYLDESAPVVSVKLQEVFGLQQTPRIGGGAVAVTFKLLSPAQRPVQITRDLAGFWRSSYIEVRKEMRGRYPRHHWPENPLEAAPSRKTMRPRGSS